MPKIYKLIDKRIPMLMAHRIHYFVATKGIPFDIIKDEAQKRNLILDIEGYGVVKEQHKRISK